MTALSVNVNKIAWLRNAREGSRPDLLHCCKSIIDAGAQGITVHPRPDQRHIRPVDARVIAKFLENEPSIEFNIEGNPEAGEEPNGYPGFLELVESIRPAQCTLVPDDANQLTSDHGFDFMDQSTFAKVSQHISHLKNSEIRVSVFLDPVHEQVRRAADAGTDRIEFYTGPWVELTEEHGLNSDAANECLEKYRSSLVLARELGLEINAGHDLNLLNLQKFCTIGQIDEVSIGHALISDALDFGLQNTVKKYLTELSHVDRS